MTDEKYTFETARVRLEEIAAEVRKKDTSLEKSLDLLEEGVRLASICTELVDHTDVGAAPAEGAAATGDAEQPDASAE
jgi:exodeoxyribonuclease VII small subunit